MSAFTNIYNLIFKRNSTYVASVFAGAFAFQAFFDAGVTSWYEAHNRGKLWKDIKGKIGGGDEDEEDDDE
ncbi:Ubiquinol cytochrome-c reductase complex subunit 9 [Komagataella phaffii CBS 7435]|uniref:Complex III subunit 9 n=2 Tax=Komagataella phaffii TaxID=460519 RepID=C4R850_KOMPG|nr:Hypothetical protein PAS_chr4_0520 [Komagataella phaffii GS115]CAH2450833.1 Ubiquinol cytochrome-c reductase complex subunit 9 [Komagataella phaffii CBS 7435]CAY71775.1 Hypothetical protein PAS_chr4_0520 [Komagataella phaffii GS115]CCA40624.1 Ubiquinol cytochrome-c reductase complex subunit 9 [Komagataella phaffii CBS 7435]